MADFEKYGLNLVDVVQDTHADTMIRVSSLVEEMFELALRRKMLVTGQEANDKMFRHDGELATLYKKINRAKELGLLDDVGFKDADLIRKIRNEFAHRKERLHFDSRKVVELAQRLSTYEAAEHNQGAILAGVSNVIEQLEKKN